MKHKLVNIALKSLRRIAVFKQIGNPVGKAPTLVLAPSEAEKKCQPLKAADGLYVWQLQDVTCSGLYGGAVINKQNQVYGRFLSFPWGNAVHLSLVFPYLGRSAATLSKAILLLTPVQSSNYYHWIADVLPRLLLIEKCNLSDFDERWVLLHQTSRAYELDTLAIAGVSPAMIFRFKPFETVRVQDLVVADFQLSFSEQPFPAWKRLLLTDFKHKALTSGKAVESTTQSNKKIYLLRGKQRIRRLIGEERLIAMLQDEGFHILDPQQLTLVEQVRALADAQVVVALHGAALTNIVFCAENTLIIELRSTHKPPNFFLEIAKTYKLRFESISIPPKKMQDAPNLANKQHLVLTDESIDKLQVLLSAI